MPTPPPAAADNPEVRSESPWTREDVVRLLRVWRLVAAAAAAATPSSPSRHEGDARSSLSSSEINTRIFEKFQEVVAAGVTAPRTFKSVVKTRKSLLRSYRFIAVFNQNHIIAKSMSSAFGGQNWFALPQHEQRRIVDAHYKRKPFAYIDEEIFDAIELILEIEEHPMAEDQVVIKRERSPSRDMQAFDEDRSQANSLPTYATARHGNGVKKPMTTSQPRPSAMWTREDMLLLIRAWEDVLDAPREEDEQMNLFDNHVYERFTELCGGYTSRSSLAVKIKRYALIPTFQFISDFNQNKIATKKSMSHRKWHALSRKEQTLILQQHYKKSHFASIDEDMLPMLEAILQKSGKTESKRPVVEEWSDSSDSSWTRRETLLLLRAWSDIMSGSRSPSDPMSASDSRIYRKFVVLGDGETARSESEVAFRKQELVNTYEMIASIALEDDSTTAEETWFSLRKGERDAMISNQKRPCADVDAVTYKALAKIMEKRQAPAADPVAALPVQPPITYTKAMMMWNREEVLQVLQAWLEALDDPPVANESAAAFNDRVCQKFLALCNGNTIRSVKAMQAKRDSILNSYQFIMDFNQQKIASTTGQRAWGTNDWFSISHEEQRSLVKTHYKKFSFSYLYSDMLPTVEEIIRKSPRVEKASSIDQPNADVREPSAFRKPRPNSWTPDELRCFLRAWREVVVQYPRQLDETISSFNARIYKRFQDLYGGTSKKAEVSLLTKRKTLTSTFEYISDFNRRNRSVRTADGDQKSAWFSMSDVERKKTIVNANKFSFVCTNIDEETFQALKLILGNDSGDGAPAPTATNEQPTNIDEKIVRRSEEPLSSLGTEIDVKNKNAEVDLAVPITPEAASAKRKNDFEAYQIDPMNYSTPRRLESNKEVVCGISNTSPLGFSSEFGTKKQKSELDLSAFTSIFQMQTQNLTSLLLQIREERKIEQGERAEILEQIRLDREERRLDREARKQERAQTKALWEFYREQSRIDREQTRALLNELASQKKSEAQSSESS
ncbi:hypothetical protein FI667_g17336, partial [Globisporangium splendens]